MSRTREHAPQVPAPWATKSFYSDAAFSGDAAFQDRPISRLEPLDDLRSMESPAQSLSPVEASARKPDGGQQPDESVYGWSHLVALILLLGSVIAMIAANMTETTTDGIPKPRADIKTLETSIIRYRHLTKTMPDSLRDLAFRPLNWSGPWRKMIEESVLQDPWGNDYRFRNPGKHNPMGYDIYSPGPDMKEDTEDDIGNWEN